MNLTAVIPCKDRDRNISLCLGSIASCVPRPPVVLVDFGSAKPLQSYVERYPWLDVVRVDDGTAQFNKARAMNVGVRRVKTRFMVATDADQIFDPGFFGVVWSALREDPKRLALSYTHYLSELPGWLSPKTVGSRYSELLKIAKGNRKFYGEGCCNGISTAWARAVRGWDEGYVGFGAEDSDFMLRASLAGFRRTFVHHGTSMIHLPHPKVGAYYEPAVLAENRARYHKKEHAKRVVANVTGPWGLGTLRRAPLPVVMGMGHAMTLERIHKHGLEGVAFPVGTATERELLEAVAETAPQAVVFDKDGRPSPSLARRIKDKSPATLMVMRYGDYRERVSPAVGELAQYIDLLLVTHRDRRAMSKFESVGIGRTGTYYGGFDPAAYRPKAGLRAFDVFFGGSNKDNQYPLSAERRRLVTEFSMAFRLDLRGKGWRTVKAAPPAYGAVHNAAMQAAKLTLGINHYDVEGYYSDRIVKSLAAGRLHLTRYIPGMEEDFDNHRDLVWFHSIEEALDLARWYLAHACAREQVGVRGRRLAEELFSYERDAQRLAEELRKGGVK